MMLDVVYALLDAGIVAEEDIEEPLGIAVDYELALEPAGGWPPADDDGLPPADDGGLPPADDSGVPPMEIAWAFGTRTQFHVGELSIVHNYGQRGWWFAVQVGELRGCDYIATGVDAHFTLFYLRSHRERVSEVAGAMSAVLEQIMTRHSDRRLVHWWRVPDFATAGQVSPLSGEELAMLDVLVSCPIHSTLHRILSAGMGQLQRRQGTFVKRAFHLSIRRSAGCVMKLAA